MQAYCGFRIETSPCRIGYYTSTEKTAKKFAKTRFNPMVRDVRSLTPLVAPAGRGKGTDIMFRQFQGGYLNISHAGSASALASDPLDVVILDECDRMNQNVGDEGSPLDQAKARVKNSLFRKIISVSSPSTEATSVIHPLFMDGTREKWYVPCPHCAHFHELHLKNFKHKDDQGARIEAHFVCPECNGAILERDKMRIITDGKAVAENPNPKPGVRSGFINEFYSPWRTWEELANDFERANTPEKLQVFWNTVLGYLWKNKGDAPPAEQLHDLSEPYPLGTIPHPSIVLLTAFVDYQLQDTGRLEIEIVGWNRHGESWSIQYDVLPGESKWSQLDEYLTRTWEHPNGATMTLRGLGIDSGAGTEDVYKWAKKHPRERVFVTKGARAFGAPALGAYKETKYSSKEKNKLGSQRLYMVGVSVLKLEFYSRLRLRPKGEKNARVYPPGFVHHPEYPFEFFEQRTAERLIWTYSKNGVKRHEWLLPKGKANEALDTGVGNRAVSLIIGTDKYSPQKWDELERQYGETPAARTPEKIKPLFQRKVVGRTTGRSGRGRMFGDSD
jgi:phage terminase large subunit GpA-like protein